MNKFTGVVCFVAAIAGSSTAFAGGFSIREQSAEGQGASFAGVAAGTNGLSSMFWNPATLSQHNEFGFISEGNAALIAPYSRAKDGVGFGGPDSGNVGELAIVPASYWSYGITDRLTVGGAFGAPFGLTTDADNGWAGGVHGDKSAVKTYNFSPNVAYQLNDWISVGVGAQIEYMQVDLTSRTPALKVLDAEAGGFGFGMTAGILLEPTDTTDIGIGFRSSVSHKLKGDGFRLPVYSGDLTAAFDSPEMVTLGIRQQVSDQVTLLGGVEWTNWSRFKNLTLVADPSGAIVGRTVENWKDGWYFSAGAEYAYSDALLLRAGVAYEKSPVPDATRTPRLPDNDRYWLSVGGSYKIKDNMTAHLAYSHVFMKDGDINLAAGGGLPPLSASFKQHLDIISVGLTTDW